MYAAFLAALVGFLASAMGSLVGRALVGLGIGYVTYKGVDVTTTYFLTQIKTSMTALPSEVVDFLAFCWVDKAIGMIFSTWLSCIAVTGLSAGLTKFRIKGAS